MTAQPSNAPRVGGSIPHAHIDIRPTDRVFITGASGSGKTRLLVHRSDTSGLIERYAHRPVVLDPKGDFPVTKQMPRRDRFQRGQAQVISLNRAQSSAELWDHIIGQVIDDGHHTLIVDDLYGINGGSPNPRPNLLWAITGGRSLYVPVWLGVQRPARLPVSILSESEHYFAFALRRKEDIKTLADNTSETVARWMPTLGVHDYIYYHAIPPRRVVIIRA